MEKKRKCLLLETKIETRQGDEDQMKKVLNQNNKKSFLLKKYRASSTASDRKLLMSSKYAFLSGLC